MPPSYGNGEYPQSALIPGYDLVANRAGYSFVDMIIAAAADGITISIVDGYRDLGTQQQLLDDLGPWSPTNPGAAPVGGSDHGHGLAVDVDRYTPGALEWLHANGERYGWRATISNEPWHFEYVAGDAQGMELLLDEEGNAVPPGEQDRAVAGDAVPEGEGDSSPGNDRYPRGAELYRTEDGTFVLRYRIRPRVFIEFSVSDIRSLRNSGYRTRDAESYEDNPVRENQFLVTYDQSGDAAELAQIPEGMSLRQFIQQTINERFPPWDPRRKNPELIAVMARIAMNIGATDAEIRTWLDETEFGASITQRRQQWMSANPAAREDLVAEQAEILADTWWNLTGERIDDDDPRIQRWARRVASGRMRFGEVISRMEGIAGQDPESPYSRATRDEMIDQGAFEAGVENTITSLRYQAAQWGVQMTDSALQRWARDIEMNVHSNEDYLEYLKDTAMTLYPTKGSREISTADWANPWLYTMERVLETGTPDLYDPRIQQALQNGTTVFEFERQLMQDPAWMETGNAHETYSNTFADLSRQMGFA